MPRSPLDLELLDPADNAGYGTWPLPCARDDEIAALVRSLTEPNTEQLQREHVPVLLAFAERMATLARREGSQERFRIGLAAAGVASSTGDQREALLVLPLLWRTAETLGLDAGAEFRSAATRLEASDALLEFCAREPEDQSIQAMGYVEVDDELGFRYERTW